MFTFGSKKSKNWDSGEMAEYKKNSKLGLDIPNANMPIIYL